MITIVSPAKLNLSLLVGPPRTDGYHPLESLVQTIGWCDHLVMGLASQGRDEVSFEGADLDPEDNLVSRSLIAFRRESGVRGATVPPMGVTVRKDIPMEAGLGGGSSNAAATLVGAAALAGLGQEGLAALGLDIGSDVPLFLTGGTLMVSGVGDVIEQAEPMTGFAFAVVVPEFGLATREVYRRWDELQGPQGEQAGNRGIPPALRDGMPLRNDLLPAALDLEPRLGDFMADLRAAWDAPVFLTGSGTACFGYFADLDEAASACLSVAHLSKQSRSVPIRPHGVSVAGLHQE